MTKEKIGLSLIFIFVFSSLGMGLWLYEIVEIKKWAGLNWLSDQLYSPFIAALLAVFAFITPFLVNKQLTLKNAIVSINIFYTVNIICFQIGKDLCYELYSRFWLLSGTSTHFLLIPFIGLALFIFLGLSYWFITHKLIKKNKKINVLFVTLLLLLSVPLSLLTIQVNSGFGSGTDWVDTVKMGYPIFWITMLLGFSGLLIARQPNIIEIIKTK